MAQLPLEQGIPRFKANEERVDVFTNGDENAEWVTSTGARAPSLRKYLKTITDEGNGWLGAAQNAAQVAGGHASDADMAASRAENSVATLQELEVHAQTGEETSAAFDPLTNSLTITVEKGERGESFSVDQLGLLSQKSLYDSEPVGFSFLATDVSLLFFRIEPTGWSEGTLFGKGDKGDKGDRGDRGLPGTTSWTGLSDIPSDFPPAPHGHDIEGIAGLQTALVALGSLNASPTEPVNHYANMIWFDTAANDLKIRNAENTDWVQLSDIVGFLSFEAQALTSAQQKQVRDNIGGVGLGVDQEWRWTASNRALNTVYTNSTGKPIGVAWDISSAYTGVALQSRINSTGDWVLCGVPWYKGVGIVPKGHQYRLIATGTGSVFGWSEVFVEGSV